MGSNKIFLIDRYEELHNYGFSLKALVNDESIALGLGRKRKIWFAAILFFLSLLPTKKKNGSS